MTKLSLFSGAHLALIRKRERVCLLPRGCHCSQPGRSIAASALSGEVELYVILEVSVAEKVALVYRLLLCRTCQGENNGNCQHLLST